MIKEVPIFTDSILKPYWSTECLLAGKSGRSAQFFFNPQ
jgi:hypothetical protein